MRIPLYLSRITEGFRLRLLSGFLWKKILGRGSKASSLFLICRLAASGGSLKSDRTGTIPFLRFYGFYHNIFRLEGKEGNFFVHKNKKCTIMKRKSIGLVKMIERNDLLTFQFYKKEKFTGSFLGMRYLIQREKEGEEEVFAVFVWPGPYNFAATSDNLKTKKTFPFQEESLQNIVCYLNDAYYIVQKYF